MTDERASLAPLAGFYGKLPATGDFVRRRLPAAWVDRWDADLQQALHACQTRLGQTWLDAFLAMPVWRFMASPGALDERAWLGVLLPSVDRVGRYFPLTLACPLETSVQSADHAMAAWWTSDTWLRAATHCGLAALQSPDVDTFDRAVALLPALAPLTTAMADMTLPLPSGRGSQLELHVAGPWGHPAGLAGLAAITARVPQPLLVFATESDPTVTSPALLPATPAAAPDYQVVACAASGGLAPVWDALMRVG